jgi:hypothetical protein
MRINTLSIFAMSLGQLGFCLTNPIFSVYHMEGEYNKDVISASLESAVGKALSQLDSRHLGRRLEYWLK